MAGWLGRFFGRRRLSAKHAAAFNRAVALFDAADYGAAAAAFAALGADRRCLVDLRMAADYAAALTAAHGGADPDRPGGLADRPGYTAVRYAVYTAAGRLARDGHQTAEPEGPKLVLETRQDGEPIFYRILFGHQAGVLSGVVRRIDRRGNSVDLEAPSPVEPRPLDAAILDTVRAVRAGQHDPVALPPAWADPVRLPPERPVLSDERTVDLALVGTADVQRNREATRAALDELAAAYPAAARRAPMILEGARPSQFGIRLYPAIAAAEQADEMAGLLQRSLRSHGIRTRRRAVLDGTVLDDQGGAIGGAPDRR